METSLSHLQVNVRPENLDFYRELMKFLGWNTILDQEGFFGAGAANHASLWFVSDMKDVPNDYDGPGVNHVGIGGTIADVDATVEYLRERGIATLFETPRHRPIPGKDGHTYYQVMFETPDRLLFEVDYTGPMPD